MKQYIFFLLILLFLFSSCSSAQKPEAEDSSSEISGSDASSSPISASDSSAEPVESEESSQEEEPAESSPYIVYLDTRLWEGDQGIAEMEAVWLHTETPNFMRRCIEKNGDCLFFVKLTPFIQGGAASDIEIYQTAYHYLTDHGLDVRLCTETLLLGYVSYEQLIALSSPPEPIRRFMIETCSDPSYAWRIPDEPYIANPQYWFIPYDFTNVESGTDAEVERYYVRLWSEAEYTKQAEFAVQFLFGDKKVRQEGNKWIAVSEGTDSLPITETIEVSGDTLHYSKEGGKPVCGTMLPSDAIVAFGPKEVLLCNNHVPHTNTLIDSTLSSYVGETDGRLNHFDESLYVYWNPEEEKIEVHLSQRLFYSWADDLGMYLRLDADGEVLEAVCRFGEAVRSEKHQISETQFWVTFYEEFPLYLCRDRDFSDDPVMQEIYDQYEAQTIWDQDACFFYSTLSSSGPTEDGLLVYEPTFLISESDQEIPYYYMIDEFTSRADKAFVRKNDPSEQMRSLLWPSLYNRRLEKHMLDKDD